MQLKQRAAGMQLKAGGLQMGQQAQGPRPGGLQRDLQTGKPKVQQPTGPLLVGSQAGGVHMSP